MSAKNAYYILHILAADEAFFISFVHLDETRESDWSRRNPPKMTSAVMANRHARSVQQAQALMCGKASSCTGFSDSHAVLAYSEAQLTPLQTPSFLYIFHCLGQLLNLALLLDALQLLVQLRKLHPRAEQMYAHSCSQYMAPQLYQVAHAFSGKEVVQRVVHVAFVPHVVWRVS